MSMRVPLHLNSRRDDSWTKRAQARLTLWQSMHDANPRGFRQAPSSRKNPRFHSQKPQTILERMYAKLA